MSRSRKKNPITGVTIATTEKKDKRLAQRRWRSAVNLALRLSAEVLPALREVSDIWLFDKDGKRAWWGTTYERLSRRK